jgi:hypothetical protein
MIGPAWLEGSGSVQQSRFYLATQVEPAVEQVEADCGSANSLYSVTLDTQHLTVGDVITVMSVYFCQDSGRCFDNTSIVRSK